MADYDLFIIGGGVNGCGIARDAAGRGLKVALAEMGDLGGATSSASTKLFHGGLRYLEYLEFRLVREALIEREVLLEAMPHIAWPMRFVLPLSPQMRFDTTTPVSRMLPFLKGRRPAWMIRLGLFLYDHLARRKRLSGTSSLDLSTAPEGAPLKPEFRQAYEYSDVWVDDARLVVLNARDAAERGAAIWPRTRVEAARPAPEGGWVVEVRDVTTGTRRQVTAGTLVNAAGPWAEKVLREIIGRNSRGHVRLVRGSHIIVPRMYDHPKAYFLQGTDGRIAFAIPYEQDFTLIGTTEADHPDPDTPPVCTPQERDYLIAFANRYFRQQLTPEDVIHTYAGTRPLYDDGASSATAATREYVLEHEPGAAPVLSVLGGKITTYRRLAEAALEKLAPGTAPWTAGVPLPGGDFTPEEFDMQVTALRAAYPFLSEPWARRLMRAYGREAHALLGGAASAEELGQDFGATLTARELDWMVAKEWAFTGEDALWRRSKLGLKLDPQVAEAVDAHVRAARAALAA